MRSRRRVVDSAQGRRYVTALRCRSSLLSGGTERGGDQSGSTTGGAGTSAVRQAFLRERCPCATGAPRRGERGPAPRPCDSGRGLEVGEPDRAALLLLQERSLRGPEGPGRCRAAGLRRVEGGGDRLGLHGGESAQRGRSPHRLLRRRRLVGVGRRPWRAAGSPQPADDGVRLEPHDAVRPGHRAPRARPRARHGARASEPLRRDQVARAGGLRQPRRTAEQLGPGDHVPQHPGEAHSATGPRLRVGPRLDHGVRVRSRSDRRTGAVRRRRPRTAGNAVEGGQGVGAASGTRRRRRGRRSSRPSSRWRSTWPRASRPTS